MSFVDFRVDGEAGGVDSVVALCYLGLFIDTNEIRNGDVFEMYTICVILVRQWEGNTCMSGDKSLTD